MVCINWVIGLINPISIKFFITFNVPPIDCITSNKILKVLDTTLTPSPDSMNSANALIAGLNTVKNCWPTITVKSSIAFWARLIRLALESCVRAKSPIALVDCRVASSSMASALACWIVTPSVS